MIYCIVSGLASPPEALVICIQNRFKWLYYWFCPRFQPQLPFSDCHQGTRPSSTICHSSVHPREWWKQSGRCCSACWNISSSRASCPGLTPSGNPCAATSPTELSSPSSRGCFATWACHWASPVSSDSSGTCSINTSSSSFTWNPIHSGNDNQPTASKGD